MTQRNPLQDAVRVALMGGVAASIAGVPATAVAQDEDVAKQDKVTVTGSRIQRVDIEGPNPLTVIDRDDIEASGEISVAEVLRGSTFNSFGSFKSSSGSSAQSQATVSLRGLGATRTLVLLDGRRISGSPTFGAGSAQNLNTIPLAAVERIEVLRDGASAVYGADAVGGVVNIILRKDYEGVQLTAGMGRPTQDGGDENTWSIAGGVSSGKGNVTFALDHSEQDIIFNSDRDFSDVGLSSFGFPGSFFASTTDSFGNAVSLGTFPDPRCPGSDTGGDGILDTTVATDSDGFAQPDSSDPLYPASTVVSPRCRYNYAGVSANEASIERDSFFVNTNYEVSDNVNFFARGIFSKTDSFGRYAPTPQVGGSPFLPTMSAGNPNNPTNPSNATNADGDSLAPFQSFTLDVPVVEVDANGVPVLDADGNQIPVLDASGNQVTQSETFTGPFDLSIFYRNVPGGFRDSLVETVLVDGLVGLEGTNDWFGGAEWEVGVQHSRQTNKDTSKGLAIRSALQNAIDSGSYDIFGVNGATDPAVAQTFIHEGFHDEETRIASFDASLAFDAFQMNTGPVPVAVGFEYRDEKFTQNYDGLQNAGNVDGSAGGQDITGARAAYAIYAETRIPVLDNLELDLKVRRDHYNDFGNSTNPQIAVAFRPIDSLLLRASYGEGFRAPSMSQLYSGLAQSFDGAIDTSRCASQGSGTVTDNGDGTVTVTAAGNAPPGDPCLRTQYQNLSGGNPNLDAEESENFTVGFVWNPLADLTIGVDYYDIELTQEIGTVPLQDILDAEFLSGGAGSSNLVTRNPNGTVSFISANNQNLEGRRTDGLDLDIS